MSMKKLTFVVPRLIEGAQAACTKCIGFFVADFYNFQITAIAGFLDFSVTGNQSRWPSSVLGRNAKGSAFSILAYHEGKYIHKRIKPQDTMRNTEFTALEAIRERVSNVKDFLDTKKILNEVFIAYFLEHDFVEGFNSHRGDVTFLLILLNDLLDELLVESLQNPIQKPCNN